MDATDNPQVNGQAAIGTAPAKKKGGRQTRSRNEFDLRVSWAACLLSQLRPPAEVRQQLVRRYECSERQATSYMAAAKAKLAEWTGKSKEEIRIDVLGLLSGLLRAPNLKVMERLQVVDRIVRLLGINAPVKVAPTNPDGTEAYAAQANFTIEEQIGILNAVGDMYGLKWVPVDKYQAEQPSGGADFPAPEPSANGHAEPQPL